MNELIVIDKIQQNALTIFTSDKGCDPLLDAIYKEVESFTGDTSTKKGRTEIASKAAQIAKMKTAIDGVGKSLVDKLKEQPKLVDAERKRVRDELDALRDKIRQPLTDWEKAEEKRVNDLKEAIQDIKDIGSPVGLTPAELKVALQRLKDHVIDEFSYEEFESEAHRAKAQRIAEIEERIKQEEQNAELEKLRLESAEREAKDREARIIAEATEKARIEAEEQVKYELESAKRKEAELKLKNEKLLNDKRLAAERAERDKEAALEAEREKHRKAEIERQAVAEKQLAEEKLRSEDKEHKRKINCEILEALSDIWIDEDTAKKIIGAIVKKEIPHIQINY